MIISPLQFQPRARRSIMAPVIRVRLVKCEAGGGRVDPGEYAMLEPWWKARGGFPPKREMLPGLGAIGLADGVPAAAAFMYLDAAGSGVAQLAWLAMAPDAGKRAAVRSLRAAAGFLLGEARRMNYWLVSATFHHPSLVRFLGKSLGFQTVGIHMSQMFAPL